MLVNKRGGATLSGDWCSAKSKAWGVSNRAILNESGARLSEPKA